MNRKLMCVAACLVSLLAYTPCLGQTNAINLYETGLRDSMARKIDRFLGGLRGSYFDDNREVAENVFDGALGGPPVVNKRVRSGVLIAGCRFHVCPERGAVLLDDRRRIEAVALIYFGSSNPRKRVHSDNPKLTIFMPRSSRSDLLRREMEDWAVSQYGQGVPRNVVWLKRAARH